MIYKYCHRDIVSLTCADDGSLGIATQAVLQDPGQFTVSVGDVRSPSVGTGQLLDDLSERHETLNNKMSKSCRDMKQRSYLVDVTTFFQSGSASPSRQINYLLNFDFH